MRGGAGTATTAAATAAKATLHAPSVGGSSSPEALSYVVVLNGQATLDAAHNGVKTFFLLHDIFPTDAAVWWVFNHRAFFEEEWIGRILCAVSNNDANKALVPVPLLTRGRNDLSEYFAGHMLCNQVRRTFYGWTDLTLPTHAERMIAIAASMDGNDENGSPVARLRVEALSDWL